MLCLLLCASLLTGMFFLVPEQRCPQHRYNIHSAQHCADIHAAPLCVLRCGGMQCPIDVCIAVGAALLNLLSVIISIMLYLNVRTAGRAH
jgi:hypothetical protein